MANFILVGGAFHGAWAWRRVAERLRGAHRVDSLDLAGQGAKAHLSTPRTTLATHVEDVVAHVLFEGLDDVVLVGHSYSGMVVTGAADRLGAKVAHLVYTDAIVPKSGQSAGDYAGPAMSAAVHAAAAGNWQCPLFLPMAKFGPFATPDDEAWLLSMMRPHPTRTLFDAIELAGAPARKRSFVYSTVDPLGIFDQSAAEARDDPDWGYHEIATGHSAMLSAPNQLAWILDTIADRTFGC